MMYKKDLSPVSTQHNNYHLPTIPTSSHYLTHEWDKFGLIKICCFMILFWVLTVLWTFPYCTLSGHLHHGLNWDLASGRTRLSSVACQRGEITYLEISHIKISVVISSRCFQAVISWPLLLLVLRIFVALVNCTIQYIEPHYMRHACFPTPSQYQIRIMMEFDKCHFIGLNWNRCLLIEASYSSAILKLIYGWRFVIFYIKLNLSSF